MQPGVLVSIPFLIALLLVALTMRSVISKFKPRDPEKRGVVPFEIREQAMLLVAAVFLIASLIAVFSVYEDPPPAQEGQTACLAYGFPDGRNEVPSSGLDTSPDDCISTLKSDLKEFSPRHVILIGHADKRELSGQLGRYYGENGSLAMTRAYAVLALIGMPAQAVVLSSGARNVGEQVPPELLKRDRSVEILVSWSTRSSTAAGSTPRSFGSGLNEAVVNSSESLTLLGFLVALSAYLATIRLFLQQEADKKKADPDHLKHTVMLSFITIADLPMVLAALLLGLHIFIFLAAGWFRVSLVLFIFAGMVMVLLHSREWAKSWRKLRGKDKESHSDSSSGSTNQHPGVSGDPFAAAGSAPAVAPVQP